MLGSYRFVFVVPVVSSQSFHTFFTISIVGWLSPDFSVWQLANSEIYQNNFFECQNLQATVEVSDPT